jgi:putative ABC transport system permease protein
MIWKTAWKNIWRNRVRSLVVISSVTVGILAGVFSIALMNGMIAQRVDDALNEEISHIQVNNRAFRINNDPTLSVRNRDSLIGQIASVPGIAAITSRVVITGMAGTAGKSAGVQIIGIDPENEKKVFTLFSKIKPGTGGYFERESKQYQALIGEDLAKELNIVRYSVDSATITCLRNNCIPEDITERLSALKGKRFDNEKEFIKATKSFLSPGESKKYGRLITEQARVFREGAKLTLTFLDRENNQVGAVFRITGLYDVANSMFEKSSVFVRNNDIKMLTGIDDDSFHELIIKITDIAQTDEVTTAIADKLQSLEVLSWKKIMPDLAMMTDMVQQFYLIFGLIILAALAFGIINTMLMVVLERTREIGMLMAIGMNKRKVFSLIMLESVFLSLTGGVAGMIMSWILVLTTSRTGINLSQYSEGFEAIGYSSVVYPVISAGFFIIVTIMIILTGVASSIYPAMKALKFNPSEAIRAD